MRLHIGSGAAAKEGWINVDIEALPGVDRVLDVRTGLPWRDVELIFAEHFLEHLTFAEGVEFLRECRRALAPGGVLRLSTPNLDWVWRTQYHPDEWSSDAEAVRDCFGINRGFSGWGHRFLWNRQTLESVLRAAGFAAVEVCRYGESRHPELVGLEEHELYADSETLPHVLVVEASGRAAPVVDETLAEWSGEYQDAFDPIGTRFVPRTSARIRRAWRRATGGKLFGK